MQCIPTVCRALREAAEPADEPATQGPAGETTEQKAAGFALEEHYS